MTRILKRSLYLVIICLAILTALPATVRAQGHFWGMTQNGGASSEGSIFSMNADGTNPTVVYSFQEGGSGTSPYGTLTWDNGLFYGVTRNGGVNGGGVIFSFDTAAGVYTKLYELQDATGDYPQEGLTAGYPDGKLYGITYSGGPNEAGAIYSFDPSTGTYQDLYNMATPTGSNSVGPLTLYNNIFYGLTLNGGANYAGVFFSFDPSTGTYTDLYDLAGYSSSYQAAIKMVVYNGTLYGINATGGAFDEGEIFSYNDAGGGYQSLYSFGGGSLYSPTGMVLYNNVLYGVANGGANYTGGLFTFDPGSGTYNEPMSFPSSSDGPAFGNIYESNGAVWGIGLNNIYEVDLTSYAYSEPVAISAFNAFFLQAYNALTMFPAPPVTGTTPQTITFSNMQHTYGDPAFSPGATVSSGQFISYQSSDPTVAKIAANQIQITGAGVCTISAIQAGTSVYAPDTATATLTVSPASLTIGVADTIKNQLQPNPVFRFIYSGFVYNDNPGSLSTPPVVTTLATTSSPQGTYPITASGAVSNNYAFTYGSGTLTIIGEYQSFTWANIVKAYGDADFDPGAMATSGLPATYTSANPAVATVNSDGTLHIAGIGTDTITATQPGDATWAPTSTQVLLTVTRAPLTIIVDNKTKLYGQADPVFTATFNGLVYSDDSANIGAVFSSTDSGIDAHAGDYVINVALGEAAASHYNIVSYTSGILSITLPGGAGQNGLSAWFSNPTLLQTTVWMTAGQSAVLQAFDAGGRLVLNQQVSLQQGYNGFTLPASGWAPGIYIVRVMGDNLNLTQTIRKIN